MELILITFVLSFIGFAVLGFVSFIQWLIRPRKSRALDEKVSDAIAACRAIDRLKLSGVIGWAEYQQLRRALRDSFPAAALPAELIEPVEQPSDAAAEVVIEPSVPDIQQVRPPHTSPYAEPTPTPVPVPPAQVSASAATAPRGFADFPDDKPAVPRRSWSDLLAGFMQEKNIRWGELASGILIVGSSVGMVVSLREELRETIPYFPALLFMLITGAIHAAGVYTLKRWNLRNTSRGVLIIGLLLVPLNFLAACILTGDQNNRRALDDPVYWLAIIAGVGGFSTMTWISSKCLLRRGNLPLFVAVMGSSLSLLITNRLENPSAASWLTWSLSLPAVVSLLVGGTAFAPRIWSRRRWSSRSVNRLWLCLGVSFFAYITALALAMIRSPEPLRVFVSLGPAAVIASVLVAWLGLIVQQESVGREATTQRIVESYGFRWKVSWVRRIVTDGGCGNQNGYEKKYGWMLAVFSFLAVRRAAPSCHSPVTHTERGGYISKELFLPRKCEFMIRFSRMNRFESNFYIHYSIWICTKSGPELVNPS